MLGALGNRPVRSMQRRPGTQFATFGMDFRHSIPQVIGFNLLIDSSALQLELLGEHGEIVAVALLPRPEMEDLTEDRSSAVTEPRT